MPLTDITIRKLKPQKKPQKLADGDGMFLLIHPNGGKYWRLKYRFAGKEKVLALGVYPEVSLADARERRADARKVLAAGNDPSEVKKEAKRLIILNNENTFEVIAREWHESRKRAWTPKHAAQVLTRMEANLFPKLGNRPITEITAPDLLAVARIIEERGAHDIAHRAMQTAGQVFTYAIVTGKAERNPAADLRGALKPLKKEHHAHLTAKDLPEFLKAVENYDGHIQTKLAMKLLLLTFVRTTELRCATWKEIDFEKAEWRIPAERMKMRDPHIVPLSPEAAKNASALALLAHTAGSLMGDGFSFYPVYDEKNPPASFTFEVAGFRYNGLKHFPDPRVLKDMQVSLLPEDANQFDSQAVSVTHDGKVLGYVPKGLNTSVRALLKHYTLKANIERINGTLERPYILVFAEVTKP